MSGRLEDVLLADQLAHFPTMYEDDRPPQTFEPLLDRVQREVLDLTDDERQLLEAWLRSLRDR